MKEKKILPRLFLVIYRAGSCTIKAESIFLNLKYPKEFNDSIIAIRLRNDHARLRKVYLADFSVEITCFGWVK